MTPKAFFSLVRIPTVFSSMSNAFAGYCIGAVYALDSGPSPFTATLGFGLAAAALFIMAGMALNDIADKDVDARERPQRPIPSGAMPLSQAWILSLGFMALGLGLLYLANPMSLIFGIALCASIFAYNFFLKGTFFGPLAMGLCRMLNLGTGLSLTWTTCPDYHHGSKPLVLAVLSLGAYITLVTFLARDEVGGNSKKRVGIFLGGLALWFAAWPLLAYSLFKTQPALAVIWLGLGLFLRTPLRALAQDPSPKSTGQMVGAMLRFLPFLDVLAMLANHVQPTTALLGLLWILPAFVVGKWFYST